VLVGLIPLPLCSPTRLLRPFPLSGVLETHKGPFQSLHGDQGMVFPGSASEPLE
jgi:hypothetical protein